MANLGSSGNEGVSIDLSPISYDQYLWNVSLEDLGAAAAHSNGSFIELDGFAPVGGVPDQSAGSARAEVISGEVHISFAMSQATIDPLQPLRIEYRLAGPLGTVVAAETLAGTSFPDLAASRFPTQLYWDEHYDCCGICLWSGHSGFNGPEAFTTPGGLAVVADSIDVYAYWQDMLPQSRATLVAGGDISSFTITNESFTQIPEPFTLALLGIGAAAAAICHRRRGSK